MNRTFLTIYSICILFYTASCQQPHKKQQASGPQPDMEFVPLASVAKQRYAAEAQAYCEKYLNDNVFSGAVLVAKNGEIVYEQYSGFKDYRNKTTVTPETPFHLASVSKTFTGMAIMRLWEQGRIGLEDSVQQYFPSFPYHGITVRMLLSHRSGLPNYLYVLETYWNKKVKATNQDVINYLIQFQPPRQQWPNRNFHYSNTNYILLASILEKVTGIGFPQYMRDSVFVPLGMHHTFVFSIADTASYVPTYSWNWREYGMDHLDCTYGDKNIYSTVRDMLLWDKAMYQHTFVKRATMDTALVPQSNERKSMHNYGLGWRLFQNTTDSVVYHNGKWHGSNTVFCRLVQDTATIIVLGNRLNRNIYASRRMAAIFSGKSEENVLEE